MAKNEYTTHGYFYIKSYNEYVDGVLGTDIKLTLKQKVKILFCKGVCVCVGNVFRKEKKDG